MDAITLHTEIAKVCPITGTSVGKEDDRATWTFVPEGATQEQIAAGQNVIDTIAVDYQLPATPAPEDVALFNHENRLRTIEGVPPLTLADFTTKLAQRTL